MNIEDYIESGVVEAYALGLLTKNEQANFEKQLSEIPQLRHELKTLETQLEYMAFENKVQPATAVWTEISNRIHEMPVTADGNNASKDSAKNTDTLEIYGVSNTQIRVHKYWRPAFIAIFILSKIFLALAIFYYISYRQSAKQMERLELQLKAQQIQGNVK